MAAKLPRLTEIERANVLNWVNERLLPWSEVWARLDKAIEHFGFRTGPPEMRAYAESLPIQIVGGNGGRSWKRDPSFVDIDFAVVIDRDFNKGDLTFLTWVGKQRFSPDEIVYQTSRCTIPGIELEVDGVYRRIDVLRPMKEHNGKLWACPGTCRHCARLFYDAKFNLVNGVITHESCALPA